ncbi:MAG: acylphosphatase [Acidobacteria bacterium]|nr:acylphosphatase [Acidobacteriota bacterium]
MLKLTRARRYLVTGRVQGVGYRNFAARAADETGVRGWVRNLDDGCVEALAIGNDQQLAEFAGWLWRGPRWAEVRRVDEQESAPESCEGFRIR